MPNQDIVLVADVMEVTHNGLREQHNDAIWGKPTKKAVISQIYLLKNVVVTRASGLLKTRILKFALVVQCAIVYCTSLRHYTRTYSGKVWLVSFGLVLGPFLT